MSWVFGIHKKLIFFWLICNFQKAWFFFLMLLTFHPDQINSSLFNNNFTLFCPKAPHCHYSRCFTLLKVDCRELKIYTPTAPSVPRCRSRSLEAVKDPNNLHGVGCWLWLWVSINDMKLD